MCRRRPFLLPEKSSLFVAPRVFRRAKKCSLCVVGGGFGFRKKLPICRTSPIWAYGRCSPSVEVGWFQFPKNAPQVSHLAPFALRKMLPKCRTSPIWLAGKCAALGRGGRLAPPWARFRRFAAGVEGCSGAQNEAKMRFLVASCGVVLINYLHKTGRNRFAEKPPKMKFKVLKHKQMKPRVAVWQRW